MICHTCNAAIYFEAKYDHDTAVILHRDCEGGGCICRHQDGKEQNAESLKAR